MVHNVRSAHNVGSILRTADGLGVDEVIFTGYTPYPAGKNDQRLPHVQSRISSQIAKTALGAEKAIRWSHFDDINDCLERLAANGYEVTALEQTPGAIPLNEFEPSGDIALVVGNEVEGLDRAVLDKIDRHTHIPMAGAKESFNVSVATAIALYHIRAYQGLDK